MTVPDRIVFDAEPLIAHAEDERGSQTVAEYLDAVGVEDVEGYASLVNISEIRYILARKYDRSVVDDYLGWLFDLGVEPVEIEEVWVDASEYVLEYNPALGDSFALATADHLDATLLIGGDDDYDEVSGVRIERFRDSSG
ncbi:type II toxin-antitoxin system VapC family toxin [Natronoglomus mannanivorans]|uniref:PIN domain-containing protein n=1 Tax=Natronoglomus mannanivorans TaxID=2979990 RepID=A0AAP2Z410_9EURY|nr:PIN domain-containing protein [Halobacteria archaeon AArc-xg1-1]